jgi:hypothetical protein
MIFCFLLLSFASFRRETKQGVAKRFFLDHGSFLSELIELNSAQTVVLRFKRGGGVFAVSGDKEFRVRINLLEEHGRDHWVEAEPGADGFYVMGENRANVEITALQGQTLGISAAYLSGNGDGCTEIHSAAGKFSRQAVTESDFLCFFQTSPHSSPLYPDLASSAPRVAFVDEVTKKLMWHRRDSGPIQQSESLQLFILSGSEISNTEAIFLSLAEQRGYSYQSLDYKKHRATSGLMTADGLHPFIEVAHPLLDKHELKARLLADDIPDPPTVVGEIFSLTGLIMFLFLLAMCAFLWSCLVRIYCMTLVPPTEENYPTLDNRAPLP